MTTPSSDTRKPILVLGATGKTGRRVAERLTRAGASVRIGSRRADPAFDWARPDTWDAVLDGVGAVYVAFHPDLAVPGAADAITTLVAKAEAHGVERLVLLSGRGEREAERCEDIVRNTGLAWTILRCGWFAQNFSESFMRDMVMDGVVALPAGEIREPFVDVEDIAEIAAQALAPRPGDRAHAHQLYELTGPRALSFAEVAARIGAEIGRPLRYLPIRHADWRAGLHAQGLPAPMVDLLAYLFEEILDGRNSTPTDGVARALGRPAASFEDYVRRTAGEGAWAA